jgi:hypothetical protein
MAPNLYTNIASHYIKSQNKTKFTTLGRIHNANISVFESEG